MTAAEIADVATRFFDAIERADIAAVAALYDDDVVIHHHAENVSTGKAANLSRLEMSTTTWPNRRYAERDLRVFAGGFVQRHVIERPHRGTVLRAPACILCDVAEGRITTLHEYFDLAQMALWRA